MSEFGANNGTLANFTELVELDYYVCGMVDFSSSGIECSQRNPSMCFKCRFRVTYISGESINDYHSTGHLVCRVLAIIVIIFALMGLLTNELIVCTIRKRRHHGKRSFDHLVCALSRVDNFCCLSSLIYCCGHLAYYDNLFGRGKVTLYCLYISSTSVLLGRVTSMYVTLLISIERYLAIACPLSSRAWYSVGKTKVQLGLVACLVTLLVSPAYTRLYVGPNIYGDQDGGLDVPSYRGFDYIFLPTRFYCLLQASDTLVAFAYIFQYIIPVPALFILNVLTYRKVILLSKERRQLSSSQKKELQPTKQFLPVVIVFLCTNVWPVLTLVTLKIWGVNFRETLISFTLATTINSSINFWIYFFQGSAFRAEVKSLFTNWPVNWSSSVNVSTVSGQVHCSQRPV